MQSLQTQEPIGFLVAVARRRIKAVVTSRARPLGLTAQELWVLVSLMERGGGTLGDLAARARVDPPAASRLVTSLVRKGLVRMERDPGDRRRVRLALRPKAEAKRAAVLSVAAAVRSAVGAGFTPGRAAALRAGLRRVIENMDRVGEGNGKA